MAPIGAIGPQSVRQHPLLLDRHTWTTLVRTVMVRHIHRPLMGASYADATEPAFLDEEVRYLAEALPALFERLTPQEWVVFALARESSSGAPQVTSGAWFAEDGRIHLRLANYRVAVTMPAIRARIWADPLFGQGESSYELVPGERQAVVTSPAGTGRLFKQDPVELVIEYGAPPNQPTPSSPRPSATSPAPAPSSVEESLTQLKRLYEQGLITEDDYRLKKQQLLDRL